MNEGFPRHQVSGMEQEERLDGEAPEWTGDCGVSGVLEVGKG